MAWPELEFGAGLAVHRIPTSSWRGQLPVLPPQMLWQQLQGPQTFPGELDNLGDISIQPSKFYPQASGLLLGKPISGLARAFLESGAFPKAH